MRKFKTRIKNGQLEIRHKLAKGEEPNNRELEILSRNNIRGLARLQESSPRGFVFSCPEAIPLINYLSSGLTREDFAFVIAQIVRIAQKIDDYSLQQSNLELSLETVYIIRKTRELIFVYRPVISTVGSSDINAFMNSLIRHTSFSMQQDTKYVEELEHVLKKMEKFPSELMSNYVRRLDTKIFNFFLDDRHSQRKPPRSAEETTLIDQDEDLTGLLDEDEDELPTSLLDEDEPGPEQQPENIPWWEMGIDRSFGDSTFRDDDQQTNLLDEDDDLSTGLLNEEEEENAGNVIKGQSLMLGDDDNELFGCYGRSFSTTVSEPPEPEEDIFARFTGESKNGLPPVEPDYGGGSPWRGQSEPGDERDPWRGQSKPRSGDDWGTPRHSQSRPVPEEDPTSWRTQVLPEDVTTLYRDKPTLPWLQRCSNGERTEVDKPVFRIGKDKYHVDYFVDGNPAVSRNHAHIVTRNGRCFLVDDNSLNHSFVDGMIVPVQKEYEIFDGSRICLANEDFVFHMR